MFKHTFKHVRIYESIVIAKTFPKKTFHVLCFVKDKYWAKCYAVNSINQQK